MSRTISFALGCLWRWNPSQPRNTLLAYVKNLKINGVEITFSTKEELYKFKLTSSQIKWLRQLKYVSIHAPFGLTRRAGNQNEVIKQLEFIEQLYKKVNAKNVIIHPRELPAPAVLKKFKFKVSTENMTPKNKFTIADLKTILKKQ